MSDDDVLATQRRALDAEMERHGQWPTGAPWLREAFAVLPRDRFAPERLWSWGGWAYVPVDRAADPDAWADEVYGDVSSAAITQVAGGHPVVVAVRARRGGRHAGQPATGTRTPGVGRRHRPGPDGGAVRLAGLPDALDGKERRGSAASATEIPDGAG